MHVNVLESEDRQALASFLASSADSPIEQSWAWGELQTTLKGRPAFRGFAVQEDGEWLASLMVIRQEMGMGKSWLWAPRGPVFKAGLSAEDAQEAWKLLQDACKNWARLKGDVFLRVEPGVLSEDFNLGGKPSRKEYCPSSTLILDLTLSEKELLEQMTQKGRYNIKVAEKAGVRVRRGTSQDLTAFYAVLNETSGRDGFSVHDLSFYEDFMRILGDSARLYVAEHEGRMLGGLLATFFGDTATYYFGASSNEDRKVMAPYLLQWTAILDAKKEGYKKYDFLGIAPEGDGGHVLAGVTQFKTRFGGKRVDTCGARVFVYRRLWWLLYRVAKSSRR